MSDSDPKDPPPPDNGGQSPSKMQEKAFAADETQAEKGGATENVLRRGKRSKTLSQKSLEQKQLDFMIVSRRKKKGSAHKMPSPPSSSQPNCKSTQHKSKSSNLFQVLSEDEDNVEEDSVGEFLAEEEESADQ